MGTAARDKNRGGRKAIAQGPSRGTGPVCASGAGCRPRPDGAHRSAVSGAFRTICLGSQYVGAGQRLRHRSGRGGGSGRQRQRFYRTKVRRIDNYRRKENDECLLLMATALKDLAIEQNISIFTSTQVNARADDNTEIRNESSLAGGRSTINKADNGMIMARPTKDEIDILTKDGTLSGATIPNIVIDIFKVRSGNWNQVRVWRYFDLGTLRIKDLFVTDSRLMPIQNLNLYSYDWEITKEEEEYLNKINKKG